jgi:hypothetical protein
MAWCDFSEEQNPSLCLIASDEIETRVKILQIPHLIDPDVNSDPLPVDVFVL